MSTVNLTAREQELLCAVIEVMKAEIKWPEVAKIAKYNTAKQARDKWPGVRAKLTAANAGNGEGGVGEATPKSSAKKAAPRKRKTAGEDDSPEATPSKGKKAKTSKADTPVAGGDQDDEETKVAVKPEPSTEEEDDNYLLA